MKRYRIVVCLITILALLCLAGCGAKETLVGTWETTMETSVLGIGQEPGRTVSAVMRFSFQEDGSGSWDADFGGELPAASRLFQYSLEGDQLALEYTEGENTDYFTVALNGDALTLDGRANLELTRVD